MDLPKSRMSLRSLTGRNRLILELLYGSGLSVSEFLRLRVKDVDLERLSLTIHDGKGRKDHQTLPSPSLVPRLAKTIGSVLALQRNDHALGIGPSLPYALGAST